MSSNLQNPIFTDEAKAREWLEARVWPNGPICPHCGNADHAKLKALQGKAHRPGLYQCADCRDEEQDRRQAVYSPSVRNGVRSIGSASSISLVKIRSVRS